MSSKRFNRILMIFGNFFTGSGSNERALKLFNRVLSSDPQFYGAWIDKSLVYKKMGRYQDALHCLDESLTINPQNGGHGITRETSTR
nr:tetratricopeptide repeat protein [uncultured Methanobacterium sp.]